MPQKPRSNNRRIFASSPLGPNAETYEPDAENMHYLTRVLRLRDGDEIEIADGTGRLYGGTLRGESIMEIGLLYEESLPADRTLIAALIKGNRWDTLIEKAAEIGATRIIPVEAHRSVVSVSDKKAESKVERWQKIADGAARQCERLGRAHIETPTTLKHALEQYPAEHTFLLDETEPGAAWPAWHREQSIRLGVGPEGGWSAEEQALWRAYGSVSVGLGGNLLRAETAAIAALMLTRAVDYGLITPGGSATS